MHTVYMLKCQNKDKVTYVTAQPVLDFRPRVIMKDASTGQYRMESSHACAIVQVAEQQPH